MAPRLLLPFDTERDVDELASQWFRDVVWTVWTDEDLRTFARGMRLAKVSLGGAVRNSRVRLNNVADELTELLDEGGTRAINAVMEAVTLPQFEVLAELAKEMHKVSNTIRSLKNFRRAGHSLELSRRLRRGLDSEIARRLRILEATHRLAATLGLDIARRQKQGPQRAFPVVRLADVFVRVGFSKRRAFQRTATFLRKFDPQRYGDLRDDQVRHRYEGFKKRTASERAR